MRITWCIEAFGTGALSIVVRVTSVAASPREQNKHFLIRYLYHLIYATSSITLYVYYTFSDNSITCSI